MTTTNAIGISTRWLKKAFAVHEHTEPEPASIFERGLTLARRIDDPFQRAVALADVSCHQAEMGDRPGAAKTVQDAIVGVTEIRAEAWRDRAVDCIARSQAEIGDHAGACATASRINDPSLRAAALVGVAEAQAKTGDVAGALTIARTIDDASSRDTALALVAEAQARAGDAAGALVTAREIAVEFCGAAALVFIAEAQAKAGEVADALATARGIAFEFWRVAALAKIASAQADLGLRQDATATAREALAAEHGISDASLPIADAPWRIAGAAGSRIVCPSWSWRAYMVTGIVEALAKAGDVDGAIAAARNIDDTWARAMGLATVAKAKAEAADRLGVELTLREAFIAANKIEEETARDGVLGVLAEIEGKVGSPANALEFAGAIQSPAIRALALAEIARAIAQTGDRHGAADTFQKALANAQKGALDHLGAILRIQAEAGDVATALKSAETIEIHALRATALARIAAGIAARR